VLLRQYILLWVGYGTAVAGGLIVIGHAAEISKTHGFSAAHWVTPAIISICGMVGSFAGGWLADHVTPAKLLTYLPVISATALIILAIQSNLVLLLLCLGVIGFIYGAIVTAYPATITQIFGIGNSPRIYGRIFTAWGAAGFLGPWMAGLLFDQTGTYSIALSVAIGFGLLSSLVIVFHHSTGKLH
jgi:OFA family oxalate/formate antiporter-like MFS transporter